VAQLRRRLEGRPRDDLARRQPHDRLGDHGYRRGRDRYSADGKFIYNSSIGNVGYEAVTYANNTAKGTRKLVKVDAETLEVVKSWTFDWGIRPSVITADGTILYADLSYLNGAIKYDLLGSMELARNEQPLSEYAMQTYANYDEYPHDSAHHGIALSGDGTRLCDCGTIDNTVSIITTADMQTEHTIDVGSIPYWATNSPDGKTCFVSLSGSDAVSVIDYATGTEVTTVPVGRFPQRSRLGRVPQSVIALLLPAAQLNYRAGSSVHEPGAVRSTSTKPGVPTKPGAQLQSPE
jgi:YVTN family beta-propeller protein